MRIVASCCSCARLARSIFRTIVVADEDRTVLSEPDTGTLMRNLMVLAALAALASLPVAGGEVYKCKGPKGDITYTNIKCPDHTDTEHYATYQPEQEPPPSTNPSAQVPADFATVNSSDAVEPRAPAAVPTSVPESVSTPARPSGSPVAQVPAQPESSVSAAPANVAAGYKCSDGQNVWLQSTPCPPMTVRSMSPPGEPSAPASAPVAAASVAMPANATPDQASSKSALCDQLIAQVGSPEHPRDGAGADELNKLLAANDCKR